LFDTFTYMTMTPSPSIQAVVEPSHHHGTTTTEPRSPFNPSTQQEEEQKLFPGDIRGAMISPNGPASAAKAKAARTSTTADTVPMVTPLEGDIAEEQEQEIKETTLSARRSLFPTSKRSLLVSPSPSSKRRKASEPPSAAAPAAPPVAKRRLIFGKYVDLVQCAPNVSKVYKIVRKLTGSIGGNGYCGPIYGELTMGSMQKMIDLMIKHTCLDSTSRFIDVGSGIGKPNLHVAQYPGVAFSCGVEMEHARWSLGLTCLKAVLDAAVKEDEEGENNNYAAASEQVQGNTVFLHKNITEAKTFDPFTHVYMFSIGT
jgi:hypothetical protein